MCVGEEDRNGIYAVSRGSYIVFAKHTAQTEIPLIANVPVHGGKTASLISIMHGS